MSQSKDHAALGLSLGEAGVEAGAASKITAGAATGTDAAASRSPISTRGRQELHSGDGHETGAGVLAHPAIPPPPSPRVHRSRTRGSSGGMTSSKSVGDLLHLGLAMTSPAQPSIEPIQAPQPQSQPQSSAIEPQQLTDEPAAARFYYRMHNTSRSTSPTRTPSVSPSVRSSSARSTSPGVSPAQSKRNLTLAPGSTASSSHAPGATLSASLSPNSHFLQQHLPPTFPIPHVSPDRDVPDPLSQSWSGSHLQPAQVILTPTTQEWRELKGIGALEDDGHLGADGSDSDDADSKAPWSSAKSEASSGLDYFSIKGGSSGVPTPLQPPVFQPVITAPSPLADKMVEVPDNGAAVQPTSAVPPELEAQSQGFTSIGRRDSLRQKERKGKGTPKAKTKRELERERLFKMVDEEIAESGGEGSEAEASDRVSRGVGVGSPSMSPTSPESAASLSSPEAPAPAPEAPRAPYASDHTSPPKASRPPFPLLSKTSSSSVPTRPSPLQMDSSRVSTPSSDGSSNIVNLGSEDDHLTKTTATANETERYEAIRDYARQMSTRKALDSGPSRPGSRPASRAHSRRGSYDGGASPPRSPRRRDTLRVSLVAGRVIRPADYPDLKPLTPAAPGTVLSPKTTLQSFSPFRRSSPVGGVRPGLAPAAGSYASSIAAPSEIGTPDEDTNPGGVGGHGIDDYVIVKEAGKGAYGLVMRARVKGAKGEPVGDEVIIKYVIKSRILADCWKKHKVLGPIPVEIHVMDQVRHLIYLPPVKPHPWDPFRPRTSAADAVSNGDGQGSNGDAPSDAESVNGSRASTPASQSNVTSRYISGELKHAPERGHPNVCKLLDFFEDREFYYLVMPRYGNGEDLFDYVEAHADGLSAFEVRSFVGQLTDAVRFLHTNGIVHRDIKDENVILDGDGRCQLIDFGSAAHWRPGKRWDTFSGTLHYASPEILRGEMYGGKEQDVWALGTVAYVLLVGETPFSDLPDEVFVGLVPGSRAVHALMARCGGEHADEGREADGGGALRDAVDFVTQCLQPAVGDRPTAETLLLHRYLAGGDGWTGFRGWERK